MRLILFVAIVGGILAIFGIVYGISFLVEKNKKSKRPKTVTKAPDDDPQFLRDLARRLAEEEHDQKGNSTGSATDAEAENNDGKNKNKDKPEAND